MISGEQTHGGRNLPSDAKHARQQAAMIGQMEHAGAPPHHLSLTACPCV